MGVATLGVGRGEEDEPKEKKGQIGRFDYGHNVKSRTRDTRASTSQGTVTPRVTCTRSLTRARTSTTYS